MRILVAMVAVAGCAGCGRSQGVQDRDLGGLVAATERKPRSIDVDLAAKDPAELGAALTLTHDAVIAALGPHTVAIVSAMHVSEGGKPTSDLDDKTSIELGERGTYHATYTNSADYGRETIFVDGKLYLRPRYQRWHGRAPETPDEAARLEESYYEPVSATWDLISNGVELTDRGPAQVAGRAGRKIELKPAGSPRPHAAEPIEQRKWREHASIDALTGEVVLDADKGVPLSVKLSGTIGFSRDGRRFAMQVSVQSDVTAIGKVAVVAPASEEVVATPERMREVDDRDYLLQGIAPPLRKNTDGTAVPPAPVKAPPGAPAGKPKTK